MKINKSIIFISCLLSLGGGSQVLASSAEAPIINPLILNNFNQALIRGEGVEFLNTVARDWPAEQLLTYLRCLNRYNQLPLEVAATSKNGAAFSVALAERLSKDQLREISKLSDRNGQSLFATGIVSEYPLWISEEDHYQFLETWYRLLPEEFPYGEPFIMVFNPSEPITDPRVVDVEMLRGFQDAMCKGEGVEFLETSGLSGEQLITYLRVPSLDDYSIPELGIPYWGCSLPLKAIPSEFRENFYIKLIKMGVPEKCLAELLQMPAISEKVFFYGYPSGMYSSDDPWDDWDDCSNGQRGCNALFRPSSAIFVKEIHFYSMFHK
jgi:hypothetical protein